MSCNETMSLVSQKLEAIFEKPRVSCYTPQSLVETVMALLSLVYNERKFVKHMNSEWGGQSRAWWLDQDLDYPTAVNRMKALVSLLQDSAWER